MGVSEPPIGRGFGRGSRVARLDSRVARLLVFSGVWGGD